MTEDKNYNLLLTAKNIYKLYCEIGNTIISNTDFLNFTNNDKASLNSLNLLIDLELISCSNNRFSKTIKDNNELSFFDFLCNQIKNKLKDVLKAALNCNIYYDSFKNNFFINRNSTKLEYSGLIMLLTDLRMLSLINNRLYFTDNDLLRYIKNNSSTKINHNTSMNPDLLDKILELEQILGNDAEEKAILYEKKRLKVHNILSEPIHVSKFDCKCGFDIASYEQKNDELPSRFIEVKSVNNSLDFYVSKNEIDCSKTYGEKYFLYLYNREKNTFLIIKNPYKEIFSNDNWEKTAELYNCRHKV